MTEAQETAITMTGAARQLAEFDRLPDRTVSEEAPTLNHYHPRWNWYQDTVNLISRIDNSDNVVDQWLELMEPASARRAA